MGSRRTATATPTEVRRLPSNVDWLTGAPLEKTTPKIVVREYDRTRPREARRPIPCAIHTSAMDPDCGVREKGTGANPERIGGRAFAGQFSRYMNGVQPRVVMEEQRHWLHWWDVEYVYRRMVARLGQPTVDLAVAYWRDNASMVELRRMAGQNQRAINQKLALAKKMADSYFNYRLTRSKRSPSAR